MKKRYHISGDAIVETATSHVYMRLSLPKWEDTLKFTCKLMNGELVAHWDGDVVVFIPPAMV